MAASRNSRRLLLASIAALVLTIAGTGYGAYTWFSTRAVRSGDSLIVGPRFSGDVNLPGAGKVHVRWEDGAPVVDAPSWQGRGPITMTFVWGFAIYHTPPGTLHAAEQSPLR